MSPGDLGERGGAALRWSFIAQASRLSLQFLIGVGLARLLSPGDFGLLGLVAVFTGFAGLFADLGLGSALIHRPSPSPDEYAAVFWLNIASGLLVAVGIGAAAPLIASFFGEPRLVGLGRMLAVVFVLGSLGTVPQVVLVRALAMKTLAIIEACAAVLSGVVGLFMAWRGFGPYSLVAQSLASALVTSGLLWIAAPWRPGGGFSFRALRPLSGFGLSLSAFNVVNYWVRNGDNLLIGKLLGPAPLGLYSRAYSLMLLPVQQLSQAFGRVMFPFLSRLQEDRNGLREHYLRSVAVVALLSFPLMAGLFVVAGHFVHVVLGARWVEMVPVLRILCWLGAVQAIGTTTGWVFQATGRTDLQLRWVILAGSASLAAIGIGAWLGTIVSVAACYAIMSGVLLFYPAFAIPGRLIGFSVLDLVRRLREGAGCALAVGLVAWAVGWVLPESRGHIVHLGCQTGAGLAVFVAVATGRRGRASEDLMALLGGQPGLTAVQERG